MMHTTLLVERPSLVQNFCGMIPSQRRHDETRIIGERHGTANTVKLMVNFITISWLELMSEMYAFGEKNGVEAAHSILDGEVEMSCRAALHAAHLALQQQRGQRAQLAPDLVG